MAARSTFRESCEGVAWQKQLRDQYLSEGTPPVPHLDVKRAMVRPVSRRLAEQIILKYEWLGTMAATRWHYGAFFGPYCAGVCCVGPTSCLAGTHLHEQFHLPPEQVVVLARGACVHWAPAGLNSKLVSWTGRLVAQAMGAKVIMAFSDTDAGEVGTIYQACNWVYIGQPRMHTYGDFVSPVGRSMNRRVAGTVAKRNRMDVPAARRLLQEHGWTIQHYNPKHRYVYVLDRSDKALCDRIERMRRPYPKRESCVRSADSGIPGLQPGGGGANPTRTLQKV